MRLLPGLLAGVLAFTVAAPAGAADCEATCNTVSRPCLQGARSEMRTCGPRCRAGDVAERGTCLRSCLQTFVAGARRCRLDRRACLAACRPVPPPPTRPCRATCAHELSACAEALATQSEECSRACPGAADKVACERTCGATVGNGGEHCMNTLRTCLARCGGSPDGAFVAGAR